MTNRRRPHCGLLWRRLAEYWRARTKAVQLCKVCGRSQNEVDFTTTASAWATVVPPRWSRWAVCLACFERFAAARGIAVVRVFLVDGP